MRTWKSLWLLSFLALSAWGCAGAEEKYPSAEAKAFFAAANEANYLGVMCRSPRQEDLSAYTSLMGVKYPPTDSVEILATPPSRPHQAFAVLQSQTQPVTPSSQAVASDALAQLTTKAKAIGADAIIICQPPGAPGQTAADRPARVEALAIKYRLQDQGDRRPRP